MEQHDLLCYDGSGLIKQFGIIIRFVHGLRNACNQTSLGCVGNDGDDLVLEMELVLVFVMVIGHTVDVMMMHGGDCVGLLRDGDENQD